MANSSFQFKQFVVHHSQTAMKVGTDGVLLGAWINVDEAKKCLDIGTGIGLLSLMLAQRNRNILIDAIDIDESAVIQAIENVNKSPWTDRIEVKNISLHDFTKTCTQKYDIIICNPPYFSNGFYVAGVQRNRARVAENLSGRDIIIAAKKLLYEKGHPGIVIPVREGEVLMQSAHNQGLYCVQKTSVYSKPRNPPIRLLLKFKQREELLVEDEIIIHEENSNDYSVAYKELTSAFYLKF